MLILRLAFASSNSIIHTYYSHKIGRDGPQLSSKRLIPTISKIELVASRRETNKFLNKNFKNYLNSQIKNRHKTNISIQIRNPFQEKSLQAVDFISWAIFRKYEQEDDSYYNLIKSKIIEENPLFP